MPVLLHEYWQSAAFQLCLIVCIGAKTAAPTIYIGKFDAVKLFCSHFCHAIGLGGRYGGILIKFESRMKT